VVAWQPLLQQQLAERQAHRLIGLLVYLPALTAQLMLVGRRRWYQAALIAPALYVLMTLVVPLITGHAALDAGAYREHALLVLALVLPVGALGLYLRRRRP